MQLDSLLLFIVSIIQKYVNKGILKLIKHMLNMDQVIGYNAFYDNIPKQYHF